MSRETATLEALQARVTELELRYMEQAALVETLDALVREQDLRLDALARRLEAALTTPDEPDDFGGPA
jgi:uncharacterized coiled-coil protein SlyX